MEIGTYVNLIFMKNTHNFCMHLVL